MKMEDVRRSFCEESETERRRCSDGGDESDEDSRGCAFEMLKSERKACLCLVLLSCLSFLSFLPLKKLFWS